MRLEFRIRAVSFEKKGREESGKSVVRMFAHSDGMVVGAKAIGEHGASIGVWWEMCGSKGAASERRRSRNHDAMHDAHY